MDYTFGEKLYKADVNTSTSGDNTMVAAPGAGKHLAIDFITIIPTSAVSVTFKTGSTAYGGAFPLDTKQSLTIENAIHNHDGVITCADNEAFVISLGGAVQVGGFIRYHIV
jgi:hypothetical protein